MLNKINLFLNMFDCTKKITIYCYNNIFIQKDFNTRHTPIGDINNSKSTAIRLDKNYNKIIVEIY